MIRSCIFALALATVLAGSVGAQDVWHFQFRAGQVVSYRMEHSTSVTEKAGGNTITAKSRVGAVKRWQCGGPEKDGGFRLELSYPVLRVENTTPNAEILLFDSANLEKSTPAMREQIKNVGKTVAVLRVDAAGKTLAVPVCTQGSPTIFESDPPFDMVLPGKVLAVGKSWERAYHITLAPPQGTNEQYDAVQKYVVKTVKNGKATISVMTEVPKMPASPLDRVPLLQKMWEGEVVFDITAGRLHATRLKIDQEIKGHQGEDSSYRFQSAYAVEFVEAK